METNFYMEDRKEGNVIIIKVIGELDAMVAPQLKEKIDQKMLKSTKQFIIDCSELIHINSLAMGILRGKLRTVREEKGDIKLVGLNEHIQSIFEMVGLDELFDIYKTETEAMTAYKTKINKEKR